MTERHIGRDDETETVSEEELTGRGAAHPGYPDRVLQP